MEKEGDVVEPSQIAVHSPCNQHCKDPPPAETLAAAGRVCSPSQSGPLLNGISSLQEAIPETPLKTPTPAEKACSEKEKRADRDGESTTDADTQQRRQLPTPSDEAALLREHPSAKKALFAPHAPHAPPPLPAFPSGLSARWQSVRKQDSLDQPRTHAGQLVSSATSARRPQLRFLPTERTQETSVASRETKHRAAVVRTGNSSELRTSAMDEDFDFEAELANASNDGSNNSDDTDNSNGDAGSPALKKAKRGVPITASRHSVHHSKREEDDEDDEDDEELHRKKRKHKKSKHREDLVSFAEGADESDDSNGHSSDASAVSEKGFLKLYKQFLKEKAKKDTKKRHKHKHKHKKKHKHHQKRGNSASDNDDDDEASHEDVDSKETRGSSNSGTDTDFLPEVESNNDDNDGDDDVETPIKKKKKPANAANLGGSRPTGNAGSSRRRAQLDSDDEDFDMNEAMEATTTTTTTTAPPAGNKKAPRRRRKSSELDADFVPEDEAELYLVDDDDDDNDDGPLEHGTKGHLTRGDLEVVAKGGLDPDFRIEDFVHKPKKASSRSRRNFVVDDEDEDEMKDFIVDEDEVIEVADFAAEDEEPEAIVGQYDDEEEDDFDRDDGGVDEEEITTKAQPRKREEQKPKSKTRQRMADVIRNENAIEIELEDNNLADDDDVADMYDDDDEDEDISLGEMRLNSLTVDFFNSASQQELESVPRMLSKFAEAVIKKRPFSSWGEMVEKVTSVSGLTTQIIWNAQDLIEEKETMGLLLNECSKISSAIAETFGSSESLDSLSVASEEDINTSALQQQPGLLTGGTLKSYQLVGLNWLVLLNKHNVNAILADEMGLGKTIQTIAFLAYLTETRKETSKKRAHLIVVPPSTHDNWEREIEKWCPSLAVLTYKGSQHERKYLRKAIQKGRVEFDVLLTTYTICISSPDDRAFLRKMKWGCVVFDEGHMLKNMKSQRYTNLMKVRAKRRLLLTGTPLQNNLLELISLLCFIMPTIFETKIDIVMRMFKKKKEAADSISSTLISEARKIMAPFVLRRLKAQVLTQLPEKHSEVVKCPLAPYQQKKYTLLLRGCRGEDTSIADSDDEDFSQSNETHTKDEMTNLSNGFMQLRKMANHPALHRCHYNRSSMRAISQEVLKDPNYAKCDPDIVFEDLTVMSDFAIHQLCKKSKPLRKYKLQDEHLFESSGKFAVLEGLLKTHKRKGDRVLIFSQFTSMLDILELFLSHHNHKFLRIDGSTNVDDRQELIDQYTEDDSIFVFLLSTKACGLGINLTAANVVILHDIDFNPYNDKQAEDRCHRVGQTRPVQITRLVAEDTVEELMLKRAEQKLQLEKDMTEGGASSNDDMASLMRAYIDLAK